MNLDYLSFALIILPGFIACCKYVDPAPVSIAKANIIGSINAVSFIVP